jgi:DNA polymerase III alpha subunit
VKIRSGYSFRAAVGKLPEIQDRLKALGWSAAPLADRNSTFGFRRWRDLSLKNGLRPVFGVELAVVPTLGEKKPNIDYWSFYAKKALRPLHDLIGLATTNPGREPSITYAQALAAPGLIKIAGERVRLEAIPVGAREVFLGLSPSLPKGAYRAALAHGIPLIATSDNYYPAEGDKEFYRVTLGRRANTQTWPMYILGDDEWIAAVNWFADDDNIAVALANREGALRQCTAEMTSATLFIPAKKKTLITMCRDGARRLGVNLKSSVYGDRLRRELELIAEKKFEDYFYILTDMIAWAKKKMIVGPARGSSAGSLVCYLLGITTIDPIKFGLIFERFIDINRTDLPDIDVDFSDTRRQLVFDYAEAKYGADHVARVGTVGLFKPRSALKQAGAELRIPSWMIEKVFDGIIQRSSGDARALQVLEDTLRDTDAGRKMLKEYPEVMIAERMEGHPNNASQHAAGVLITEHPVVDYIAIDARTKSVMCDKYDAEALNLLKIDALGLTQLSVFERTLQLIGKPDISGWLETLPLDDRAAFDVLNDGHFAGVFQFNGGALQSLAKAITVSDIEDIVALTALARPGPMASGQSNIWLKRKTGKETVTYPHAVFEPYMRDTLGIVIYQEQIMSIARELGDLSWEDVTSLRKAMSKSMGKEFFDKYGDRWKAGALRKGVPRDVLDRVWDGLCSYGSWSFNRSHAVAYGLVSYWCCWLKAHYPVEFAAATLDSEADPARQIKLLRELHTEGTDYIPIDPVHSTDRWTPVTKDGHKLLVGPLTSVKGIGPATVAEILTARARGEEIRPTVQKRLLNARTEIDSLFPVSETVKRLYPDLRTAFIFTAPTPVINVQCGIDGEILIIAAVQRIVPRDENEEINIAKRKGRRIIGSTAYLNLFFSDDTDEIFCKVDRFNFERLGRQIIDRGRHKKAIYAIKGTVPRGFRMISVLAVRYLCDVGQEALEEKSDGRREAS